MTTSQMIWDAYRKGTIKGLYDVRATLVKSAAVEENARDRCLVLFGYPTKKWRYHDAKRIALIEAQMAVTLEIHKLSNVELPSESEYEGGKKS